MSYTGDEIALHNETLLWYAMKCKSCIDDKKKKKTIIYMKYIHT